MLDPKAQAMARVRAAETLLARGWGQPSPEVDLDLAANLDTPVVFTFRMSTDEPLELEVGQVS